MSGLLLLWWRRCQRRARLQGLVPCGLVDSGRSRGRAVGIINWWRHRTGWRRSGRQGSVGRRSAGVATAGRRRNSVVAQALSERVVGSCRGARRGRSCGDRRRRRHRAGLVRGCRARRTGRGGTDQRGGGRAENRDANGCTDHNSSSSGELVSATVGILDGPPLAVGYVPAMDRTRVPGGALRRAR
jgi:hypothetical protein